MEARVDHVVVWVADPLRSLAFYERVVGLPGVRAQEFREGKAPFPSVRVSDDTIIDLMDRRGAGRAEEMVGAGGSAGHPVNHVCLAMSQAEFDALRLRLEESGARMSGLSERSFGARGLAPRAFYFVDPDGNVIEARYYA